MVCGAFNNPHKNWFPIFGFLPFPAHTPQNHDFKNSLHLFVTPLLTDITTMEKQIISYFS